MEGLESNFRTLLTFGKLIGLYPLKSKSPTKICRLFGILIPIILGLNTTIDLVGLVLRKGDRGAGGSEFFKKMGSFCFYLTGTFVYTYFHTHIGKLRHLQNQWLRLKTNLEGSNKDENLRRFSSIVTVGIYTSAILENAVFHLELFSVFETSNEEKQEDHVSSLATYYRRSHTHWAELVPYTPVQAIILIITNKLALYAWNFMDIFLIVMCRALQFQFATLLLDPQDSTGWTDLRKRCMELVEILRLFEDFLSPLIFVSYAMNMYAFCMQLNIWLSPTENQNYLHSLYSIWSFVHLLARLLLISVQAAKVNENAKRLERKAQECPDNEFSFEIERMEEFTKANPRGFGLTGLGCFIVTKKFILSIFYVAFTFEVFLQADQAKIVT